MTPITVFLGGPKHLELSYDAHRPYLQSFGGIYYLAALPIFGNRHFYLHEHIKATSKSLSRDIIYSYLDSTYGWLGIAPDSRLHRYATWAVQILQFRFGRGAWIYIDITKFFTEEFLTEDLCLVDFKQRLLSFALNKVSESVRSVTLSMLGAVFPNTFFVTLPSNSKEVNNRLKRQLRPLSHNVYNELFDAMQPKSLQEMELLTLCLNYYCNSNTYLLAIADGKPRVNLQGITCHLPTPHEQQHALNLLQSRSYQIPEKIKSKVQKLNKVNVP